MTTIMSLLEAPHLECSIVIHVLIKQLVLPCRPDTKPLP